jgi:hypothetical protein
MGTAIRHISFAGIDISYRSELDGGELISGNSSSFSQIAGNAETKTCLRMVPRTKFYRLLNAWEWSL